MEENKFVVLVMKQNNERKEGVFFSETDKKTAKKLAKTLNIEWKTEWETPVEVPVKQESLHDVFKKAEVEFTAKKAGEVLRKLPSDKNK